MLQPFNWGQGGEKLTPGQVKILRELAMSKADNPTPQNLGQGIASVGDALMYVTNMNKANEAERSGFDQVQQALAEARASNDPNSFLDVMGNEWASPAQQQIAGLLYGQAQPSWQTFEAGGDRFRYNENAPTWEPEQFFDGPDDLAANDENYFAPIKGFDANGNPMFVQPGNKGSSNVMDLPEGFQPQQRFEKVDLGTEWLITDTTTGQQQRIPKDNYTPAYDAAAGGAAAKVDSANQDAFESLNSKLPGLRAVVSELGDVAKTATYTMTGQLIDSVMRETGQEPSEAALARTKYIAMVDNQILPLLRDTFGAAFTVKEGETLRATLGDPNKSPMEKQIVLEAFIAQKERDAQALASRVPGGNLPPPAANNDDIDSILSGLGI